MSKIQSEHELRSLMKVVVVGNAGVGKTTLIQRYVTHRFYTTFKSTIGCDFLTKELMFGDRVVTMQIWDTAGQDRYFSLSSSFYRGTDCCVLVYDITSKASFDQLDYWYKQMLSYGNTPNDGNMMFVVIGTKVDEGNRRRIDKSTVDQWCATHGGIPHFEVSARDNFEVDTAFKCVAEQAAQKQATEIVDWNFRGIQVQRDEGEYSSGFGCYGPGKC